MRKCIACRKSKPEENFYSKKKEAGGKNYASSYCKGCDVKRIHERIKVVRARLIEFGGGECKSCGYSRCLEALEFHHRDAKEKDFNINRVRSFSEKAKNELRKCDLLCANCHREAHSLKA
jgi:hypothetical protein